MDRKSLQKKLEPLELASLGVEIFPLNSAEKQWVLFSPKENLLRVGQKLKEAEGFLLDWCENFSIFERGSVFTFSYFLLSTKTDFQLILRTEVASLAGNAAVDFVSVAPLWPMILPWEVENSHLFGIQFRGNEAMIPPLKLDVNLLPADVSGFPLRKSYRVFRSENLLLDSAQERGPN